MQQLDPPRMVGEIAQYEEGPFNLGDVVESDLVVVKDFLVLQRDFAIFSLYEAILDWNLTIKRLFPLLIFKVSL